MLKDKKMVEKQENLENTQEENAGNKKSSGKGNAIKRWTIIKWSLGVLVLIAGIIFVGTNSNICYNTHQTSKLKGKAHQQVVSLKSDSVCQQQFKGYDGTLQKIRVYMDNQGRETALGDVEIIVRDESGKEIGRAQKHARSIRTRRFASFVFDKQPELDADKTYTMEIRCIDFYNAQGFGIYTTTVDGDNWLGDASIDGNKVEEGSHIRCTLVFSYYDYASLICMIVLMVLGIIVACIPYSLIQKYIKKKWNRDIAVSRWISRLIFLAAPLVAYFIMESLSAYSVIDICHSVFSIKGVLNIALYTVLLLVFYVITNKTQYSAVLLWTVTFVFGLTNYFVFSFRGIPVLAADLLSIGTALNVAGSFEYTYDIWVLWATAIFATATGVMLSLAPYKGFRLIKRGIVTAVTIVIVICAYQFYVNSDSVSKLGIEDSQWKPQLTYAENGSMLSFVTSWKYVKTEKPEGYSIDNVKEITNKYTSDETSKTNAKDKKMPNVIAIMNESLADLSYDGELSTTEDYLPFIRSMKENTIKGKLYVSIWGANTANSEFEFLTGNSLAFFAPRSVPYNNYVNGIVPSLTRTLASQGYIGNNSYHPYKRSGWNREHVYGCLGFNYFYSEEHYENPEYIRNFISDKSDMEQIIKDYEATRQVSNDPFYLFNVTVQNHGGYVGNRGFVNIDVKSTSEGMDTDDVNQYLTLAKKSDEAFELLIKYFEKVDEPTVIVMFGDHQPPLTNEFYSNLFGTDVDKFSTDQTAAYYSTPYVIWANYDIEEKQDVNMSANYLSSYVLELIGADLTGYNKYLLDLQKKLPVITGLFYAGDDGVFRTIDETSEYSDLIDEYSQIQYNGLFDQRNRIDDFFFLKDGDYEIEVETEE